MLIIAQIFLFSICAEAKYRKSKPQAQINSQSANPQASSSSPSVLETPKDKEIGLQTEKIHLVDQNPLRKVARGAANASLGWLEIPRQTIKETKNKGEIGGAFWGPLKGFAFFVGRTAIGVYEIATFLLPPYKAVVEPEFIFSDEERLNHMK
jgi:putative exosortase-associated protein (TIGR04073 family)